MLRRATLAALATITVFGFVCAHALATTRVVAPGAARQASPCTVATPCDYYWAISHSTSGDTVSFESGQYDYDGSVHTSSLPVPGGVTLSAAPGDASRPVIKQTVGYANSNAAVLSLDVGDTVEDLEVDQAAGTAGHTAGAVDMGSGVVVERAELVGVHNGMYFTGSSGTAELRDSVVIAHAGIAVSAFNGGTHPLLDNVTAIAHGTGSGEGIALDVDNLGGASLTRLDATNTIARGDVDDALVDASTASGTLTLHYSDARVAFEHTQGTGGTPTLNDSDHPMRLDPMFVSSTNFTEAASSPTIDSGIADPASGALDYSGLSRTVGPATDIGATEFGGAAPAATTGAASPTGPSTATVTGAIAADDLPTTWRFEYGTTTAYGSSSPTQTLAGGLASLPISTTLSGLAPDTTYHFRLVAANSVGPSTGADGTFTTAPPATVTATMTAPAIPGDATPPIVSALKVAPARFAVVTTARARGKRHHDGASITFKLSERAEITISFARETTGIKSGKACVARGRKHVHGKPCMRYRPAGSLTWRSEPAGKVSLPFTGRVGHAALAPGRYRLMLTATDAAGNKSITRTARFTIVGG